MQELFVQAGRMMKKANKILIISHKKPDGDTLGATIALAMVLERMGKEVKMACVDTPGKRFDFLPNVKKFEKEFVFDEYDLIIVTDAGASYMTKYHEIYPNIFSGVVPVINIDHHPSNDDFGALNIVDANSASTTVILYKMFRYLEIEIDEQIAICLLCGIYNDTGGLMHSNTSLEVFEITGHLVEKGARTNVIAQNLFKNISVNTLKVWGKALERATINDEGVVVTVLTQNDLLQIGARSEDISGLVDFLNAVPGSKFTVLLNEDEKGNVKGSFRTRRDDVDLAELASKFGGGGHKKAAGFTMQGRIHQQIHWRVLPVDGQPAVNKEIKEGKTGSPKELLSNILQIPEVEIDQ